MGWNLPSLLLLLCIIGLSCSVPFHKNCPLEYKQYGNWSCFKLFNGSFSFQKGLTYCHLQHRGMLLTISNDLEYDRTSVYIKLYGNSESYWTGLMYRNNPEGELVLTDADGNSVNASIYDLGSYNPTLGNCVYMKYSDEGLMFIQDDCDNSHNVVCVTEWSAVPVEVSISSSPNGYGIEGQQVVLTCEVSTVIGADTDFNVVWKFKDNHIHIKDGYQFDKNGSVGTLTIDSFQVSMEGYYSCEATTRYWIVSSNYLYMKTAAPPMISRQPMDATFYVGQQGFFECLPGNNSFPKPSVTWYRNGNRLNTDIDPSQYFVSPNTYTLLLSQVDANDTGDYHCVLTNPVNSSQSCNSHLNVSNSPVDDIHHSGDSISDDFLLSPQPLTVLVGENATFDCVGEEETMGYQWIAYDNDGMVMSITNISIPEDHFFSSQTYTNVGLHGIHKVQCVLIVNDTVIFSEKVTLEVVERAHVVNMGEDATVQYGTDFNLTCHFAGTPTPLIEWLFNGDHMEIGEYTVHDQISVLTVKNFQPSRVGVYQCLVSNQYGSGIESVTLYGRDGQPDYVIASLLTISKYQILVSWFTINPNSDPDLIQFEVTWTNANNDSAVTQSKLLLLSDQEYSIADLNPFYHLNVTVAAITPSIRGLEIPLPLIYPFGNAPTHAPENISVIRTVDNKALNISWSAIIPDHTKGEGDMSGYEIEYRNKKTDNATVMEHVYGTWVYIEGLYGEGVYEVHVRCVVMVQSIPLPTKFEKGPWSGWKESDGERVTAAPLRGSSNGNDLQVAIPVSVISVILIVLVAGCVIYRLWHWVVSKRRARSHANITYSSMKNENADSEDDI